MFDKNQFLDNVSVIAEQKGISINSLEKLMGVSIGYLAKLRKDDTRKNITADLMIKISDALQISIDYLCKVDCDGLTGDELNVLSFFEKIKRETLNNKYKWEEEDSDFIEMGSGRIAAALTTYNEYGNSYFISKFKNKVVHPVGKSYYVDIKNDMCLILIRIEGDNSRSLDVEAYLVVYGKKTEVNKLCAICHNQSSMLDNALVDLYKVAEVSGKRIALDDKTSRLIKSFLSSEENTVRKGVKF